MPTLTGHHINLRDWRLDDLEPLRYWLRPEHRWRLTDGPYYPMPTEEEREAMIARHRSAIESGRDAGVRRSLVIADGATGALIGQVTRYWIGEETNWLAQGITIFDDTYHGRGLGYEALGLWCDYLWSALPLLIRLDLRTWSGNHAMQRLALKLGYREEARFRKARIVDGVHYDGLGYGVLREEWEECYPHGFARHLHQTAGDER